MLACLLAASMLSTLHGEQKQAVDKGDVLRASAATFPLIDLYLSAIFTWKEWTSRQLVMAGRFTLESDLELSFFIFFLEKWIITGQFSEKIAAAAAEDRHACYWTWVLSRHFRQTELPLVLLFFLFFFRCIHPHLLRLYLPSVHFCHLWWNSTDTSLAS